MHAGTGAPASLFVAPLLDPPDDDPDVVDPLLLLLEPLAAPELDEPLPSFIPTIGAAGFPSCSIGSKSSVVEAPEHALAHSNATTPIDRRTSMMHDLRGTRGATGRATSAARARSGEIRVDSERS